MLHLSECHRHTDQPNVHAAITFSSNVSVASILKPFNSQTCFACTSTTGPEKTSAGKCKRSHLTSQRREIEQSSVFMMRCMNCNVCFAFELDNHESRPSKATKVQRKTTRHKMTNQNMNYERDCRRFQQSSGKNDDLFICFHTTPARCTGPKVFEQDPLVNNVRAATFNARHHGARKYECSTSDSQRRPKLRHKHSQNSDDHVASTRKSAFKTGSMESRTVPAPAMTQRKSGPVRLRAPWDAQAPSDPSKSKGQHTDTTTIDPRGFRVGLCRNEPPMSSAASCYTLLIAKC